MVSSRGVLVYQICLEIVRQMHITTYFICVLPKYFISISNSTLKRQSGKMLRHIQGNINWIRTLQFIHHIGSNCSNKGSFCWLDTIDSCYYDIPWVRKYQYIQTIDISSTWLEKAREQTRHPNKQYFNISRVSNNQNSLYIFCTIYLCPKYNS